MHCDVFFDGSGQFRDAAKHTVAQAIGRDVAEEPFDQRWSHLFEQLSPIYKWNPGGLETVRTTSPESNAHS